MPRLAGSRPMDAGILRGATRARFWVAVLLCALAGCSLARSRSVWNPPLSPPPARDASGYVATAEANFSAGIAADEARDPVAVDYFYAAAVQSWPVHVAHATCPTDEGSELYRDSVRKLLDSAARYCRFDAAYGLILGDGTQVPIRYAGFIWQSADFQCFQPVGSYASSSLLRRYTSTGVGVEYVVLSSKTPRSPFIAPRQPFAATAVLQPAVGPAPAAFTLDIYDPLRTAATETGLPLARDLTAPLGYWAAENGDDGIIDFLDPAANEDAATLSMNEPFQPEKIPVVLIHGLASSPLTWSHLQNDLRAQPCVMEKYQVWLFRYDTGSPFLATAAELRRQLAQLRQCYDPCRANPNLSRIVLIGHSLGGLVSKLQVTLSGEELWRSAAKQPLNTIRTDPDTYGRLARSFYFTPSPDVSRVVYIATPHQGSVYATRCVGKISSSLVKEPPEWTTRHEQLIRDNPDAFGPEMSKGIPTSVDLLDPRSCILQATNRLPYRPGVALNSIIGDDRWTLSEGRSDGVVAVSSARLGGVQCEIFVDASHTQIQLRQETSAEVIRILLAHAAEAPQNCPCR
ncbi:MAG: esterase/lipase family protein [Pirellulales bacterium]